MARDFMPGDVEDPREESDFPNRPSLRPDTGRTDERRKAGAHSRISRRLETAPDLGSADNRIRESRTVFYDRDSAYSLRDTEIRTLTELGRFRVIAREDIAKHAYNTGGDRMLQDIHNLLGRGLIRRRTLEGPDASPRELLTLTKSGQKLLRANRMVPESQSIYYGFVKPREANHDADIYRVYQKEATRIEAEGGTKLRVVLDFELKKKINRDFARFGTEARQEIAARHSLKVVHGKIPVPDLRIEYETPNGDLGRVDLELATEHYRPRQVAEKVRAGFSLYASRGEADRLRRVLDQSELIAQILSL